MRRKKFDPKKLIRDLKKGDRAATEYFFKQHYKIACQYVYRLIRDLDNTEVIYFEVFRKILLRIHSFNSIDEINLFLFDAITEACIKFLQDQNGEITDSIECVNSRSEIASSTDLEHKRMDAEVLQKINDLISDFPKKHYYVCKLYFIEGKRNKDVADFMNITPQEVYKLRKRCAKWLKKVFDKQDTCQQYYWLLFLSDRFKKDAGIDTE